MNSTKNHRPIVTRLTLLLPAILAVGCSETTKAVKDSADNSKRAADAAQHSATDVKRAADAGEKAADAAEQMLALTKQMKESTDKAAQAGIDAAKAGNRAALAAETSGADVHRAAVAGEAAAANSLTAAKAGTDAADATKQMLELTKEMKIATDHAAQNTDKAAAATLIIGEYSKQLLERTNQLLVATQSAADSSHEAAQATREMLALTTEMKALTAEAAANSLEAAKAGNRAADESEKIEKLTGYMIANMNAATTAKLRVDLKDALIKDDTIESKFIDAGIYFDAFEYQIWNPTVPRYKDQSRFALLQSAVKEFLGTVSLFYDPKDIQPESMNVNIDPGAEDKRQSLYALVAAMHTISDEQVYNAKEYQFAPESMYSLIAEALESDFHRRNGKSTSEPLPDYQNTVLEHRDLAEYLLQLRYNALAAIVLKELIPRESAVRGFALKWPGNHQWKPNFDRLKTAGALKHVMAFANGAIRTRDRLKSVGIKPVLDGKDKPLININLLFFGHLKAIPTHSSVDDFYDGIDTNIKLSDVLGSDATDEDRLALQNFIDMLNNLKAK